MSLFSSLYVMQCRLIEINIVWIIVIIPILWGLACYARHLAGKHNSLQLIAGGILGALTGLTILLM
jgi:membrane-associated phospholipid phosphatase